METLALVAILFPRTPQIVIPAFSFHSISFTSEGRIQAWVVVVRYRIPLPPPNHFSDPGEGGWQTQPGRVSCVCFLLSELTCVGAVVRDP